ncbi:MAG: hypothetical protein RI928_349 [Pseudomonadota bacterium]
MPRTMLERLASASCKMLAMILLAACNPVSAYVLSNGDKVECLFSHNGKEGKAIEVWNTYQTPEGRNPELGRAGAVMRINDDGWPTIIIDAEAYKRTSKGAPATWDFVYFHECAHAQSPELGEIDANCSAYLEMAKRGLMSYHRMKELEAMHLGILSLPEEYGGSGAKFWHLTLKCVDQRRQ